MRTTLLHLAALLALLGGCGSQFGEPDQYDDTGSTIDSGDDTATDDSGGPPDNDGDGYDASEDCDDDNADIYPGAPETPGDGIDSNCDGEDDT